MLNAENKIVRYKLTKYTRQDFAITKALNSILFVSKGTASIKINNEIITLASDEILTISSGAEVSCEKESNFEQIFCLNYSFLNEARLEDDYCKIYLNEAEKDIVKGLFAEIDNKENNTLIKNGVVDYLVGFCIKKANSKVVQNTDIKKIINKIDRDITAEYSTNSLAQESFLSLGYFIKKFKKQTGQTPNKYQQSLKMEKAKKLLLSTNLPIGYVAEKVGIYDYAYFSRLFKKHYGYSPKAFREISLVEKTDLKPVWIKGFTKEYNKQVAFRYTFNVTDNVVFSLAGSNNFQCYLNGELFGVGPRRVAKGYSCINNYNLNVTKGDSIAVVLTYYGNDSFYLVKENPFFACEIIGTQGVIANSLDFDAYILRGRQRKVVRYSFQRNFAESYFLVDNPKLFLTNATGNYCSVASTELVKGNFLCNANLPYPTLEKFKIKKIIEQGGCNKQQLSFPTDIFRQLYDGDIFKEEDYDVDLLKEGLSIVSYKNKLSYPNKYFLYDLGVNKTGYISLDISAYEDCEIYIMFDELIYNENKIDNQRFCNGAKPLAFWRAGTVNIIKYALKSGEYNLLSCEPYTMRYLKVCCFGKCQIKDIYLNLLENPLVNRFKFKSQDESLNRVVEAAKNTFAQNSVDILTDCPSRERAGWLCDSYFSSFAEKIFTGENLIEDNFLRCYQFFDGDEGIPQGMLPMCYPADLQLGLFIPNWAMWFVLEVAEKYKRENITNLVNFLKQKIYALKNYFLQFENKDCLLENLRGWVFVEWSDSNLYVNGVNLPSNMLYYAFLRAIGTLYNDKECLTHAEQVKDSINKFGFDGELYYEQYLSRDNKKEYNAVRSEVCQYYAFFCEVANPLDNQELYNRVFTDRQEFLKNYPNIIKSDIFIGNYLRSEVLFNNGKYDQILNEMIPMLDQMAKRTGTLWEYTKTEGSCNHGFTSFAIKWILSAVCGIINVDFTNKVIKLKQERMIADLECSFSFGKLKIKQGKILSVPTDYKVEYV